VKEFTGNVSWDRTISWYDAFVNVDVNEKNYIRQMLERGERLDEKARIWVSTIHAIKGGEQDNVILSLEQGDKIQKAIKKSIDKQDEEHRVWYVGTTRAKHNLYTDSSIFKDLEPQDKQIGGKHYKSFHIQPYEFISKNNLSFFQGNVVKYVCRYLTKNGVEDLEKIIHYCELEIKKLNDMKRKKR